MDNFVLNPKKIDLERMQEKLKKNIIQYYQALTNPSTNMPASETNFLIGNKKALAILKNTGYKVKPEESTYC